MRRSLYSLAILAVAGAAVAYVASRGGEESVSYRFAQVERGDIVSAISTSGTMSAVVTVEVGTQISGQISELRVDFNATVKRGELIGRIDPQTFEARVRQAEAELAVAHAGVAMQTAALARTRADLAGARANLLSVRTRSNDAQRELKRKEELLSRGVASARDVDRARTEAEAAEAQAASAEASVNGALAQGGVARAQIQNAEAQVQQREASVEQALIDLERTFIRSPIDGIVIDRAVNVGQTVAAALNAPVLFTIAQDLSEMQVETAVDEADIGRIREGLPVTFTVDAYPGRSFSGRVEQVRRKPEEVQNVVTYTVIVSAANPRGELLPGMTANVQVVMNRRDGVLRVPNAALRFQPPESANSSGPTAAQAAPGGSGGGGRAAFGGGGPGGGGPGGGGGGPGGGGGGRGPGALQQIVAQLDEQLGFTDAQRGQIQAFFNETGARIQRLRAGGASREEMIAEFRGSRERFNKRLIEILSPEQRTKYGEIVAARQSGNATTRGRLWIVGPDGQPKAVEVVFGATDGNQTEVVSGGITEGQQIIVGINRRRGGGGLSGIRF